MGSGVDLKSRALLVVAATLLCAAGYFWSTGLEPRWWPIWLAALPMLWLAPRVSAWTALLAAFVARVLGGSNLWGYEHHAIRMPLWVVALLAGVPAVIFALAIGLYRSLFLRGRLWLAVLAFPSVVVASEYLWSLSQGTFGSTGYTQLGNLPVLQLGALGGLWLIGFAVLLFPALAAMATGTTGRQRWRTIWSLVIYIVCVFGYGAMRLYWTPQAPHSLVVGLADSDLPQNMLPDAPERVMTLMQGYAGQVRMLAAQGAKIVVLPEMTVVMTPATANQIDALFEQTAREANVQVLLGVIDATGAKNFNEARLYSSSGAVEAVYHKHHLVPVLEARSSSGTGISILPQSIGTLGIAICRDMDYPEPARRYGRSDVGLLLVPAWDFDVDRKWHGHMALMRAVENGYSIVRSAKHGLLTVSDDRGRILAEKPTNSKEAFTTLLAVVPVRHDATLYRLWGEWFAWGVLAVLAMLLMVCVVERSRQGRSSQ